MLVKHGFNETNIALISMEKLLIFQLKWVIYMPKNIFCLIKTCTLISTSLFHSDELNCDIFASSQRSMSVKHGFNEANIAFISLEKL